MIKKSGNKMITPLRAIRKKLKRTLTQVSTAVGIDIGHLSRLERGDPTTIGTAERLSKYYKGKIKEVEILFPARHMVNLKGK